MAGSLLKRNRKPKLLGVIVDEKLTFQAHVKSVKVKAQKMLSALRILGKTEKVDPDNTEIVQEHRYSTAGICSTSMANRSV